MKTFLLIVTSFISAAVFAQTRNIYGMLKKSDGTIIKGTSTARGYEDQIIIQNYTGGTDNSATIELEVPTGAYVGELRNLMNNSTAQSGAQTQVLATKKPSISTATTMNKNKETTSTINKMTTLLHPFSLASTEISIVENKAAGLAGKMMSKILLQEVQVLSCNDDVATGKSKIKLKAKRIGWTYYSYETTSGKISNISKSGWDTAAGTAWNNF
ncbi:MAG: hypothetical protein E6Q95_02940 [Chitinophagaceae bacterium]|nr:MAG: hypothetical protein E6Q95_02940 [Chitinophagaceae bacterium]